MAVKAQSVAQAVRLSFLALEAAVAEANQSEEAEFEAQEAARPAVEEPQVAEPGKQPRTSELPK